MCKPTQRLNFTVKAINALDLKDARYSVFDSDTRGLGLAVHPGGARTFFYLRKIQGRPERTVIGAFPDVSIEMARARPRSLTARSRSGASTATRAQVRLRSRRRLPRSKRC